MKLRHFLPNHKSTGFYLFILVLVLFFTASCSRDTYSTLKLTIENKKYESLSLFTMLPDSKGYSNGWETPGKSTDGFHWTFVVPEIALGYYIRTQPFDFKKNEAYELHYSANKISDKTVRKFSLEKEVTRIKGNYTHTSVESIEGLAYLLVDTLVMDPKISIDVIDLKIEEPYHSSLEIQLAYPFFDNADRYKFDERLKIIKSFPSSSYLFGCLPSLLNSYNKQELVSLFDSFTGNLRHSHEGKVIYDLINLVINPVAIDTLSLINSRDETLKPVIKDRSKYTLVIFSASWCAPCHALIPLLKEVFNDCKKNLNLVYISTDRSEEEKQWKELLEKEAIPWYSFFARDYKRGLYKQYQVEGIPHSLLVYPDGTIETIDVRKSSDKIRLYKLVEEIK